MEFYGYKRCTTCRRAHEYLRELGVDVPFHDFVTDPPTPEQVRDWARRAGGVTALLNTRGRHFKEQGLTPDAFDEGGWVQRLSQDGRLLKRPVLVTGDGIVIGFDPEAYRRAVEAAR